MLRFGMESLCRVMCCFLFCWTLGVGIRTRAHNTDVVRQQKIEGLLRILGNYSKPHLYTNATKEPKRQSTLDSTTATTLMDYQTTTPSAANISRPLVLNEPSLPESFAGTGDSYREFYRVFYGTEEGLKHLKQHYGPNGLKRARAKFANVNKGLDDMRRANEHVLRIRTRARCRTPTPVLVRVKDYYPDPSREYFPRCTLLHKCGDTSGCCENDAYQCVPKAIQEVTLHFYTITVGKHGLGNHIGSNVPTTAQLLFDNHTACQCQPINDWPRLSSEHHKKRSSPLVGTAPADDVALAKDGETKCRECPVPFTSRTYRDGSCGCDCFYRQRPCLKIKRGRRPLSDVERSCIEANFCHIPDCEYGVYNHTTGYCPKRPDRFRRSIGVASEQYEDKK